MQGSSDKGETYMENTKNKADESQGRFGLSAFDWRIHKFGITTGILLYVIMMACPLILSKLSGLCQEFAILQDKMIYLVMFMISFSFSQILGYLPQIGPGAIYMSFVTGNVNLKMPCVASGMMLVGAEPLTRKGNAIGVICTAASAITTTLIIAAGIMLMAPLTPVLNSPVVKPALDNVLPAMFGGMLSTIVLPKWKMSVFPLVVVIVGVSVIGMSSVQMMIYGLLFSFVVAYFAYKKGLYN